MLDALEVLHILWEMNGKGINPNLIVIEAYTVDTHHVSSVSCFGNNNSSDAIDWIIHLGNTTKPEPLYTISIK